MQVRKESANRCFQSVSGQAHETKDPAMIMTHNFTGHRQQFQLFFIEAVNFLDLSPFLSGRSAPEQVANQLAFVGFSSEKTVAGRGTRIVY